VPKPELIRNALQPGQRVLWYEIVRTLGQGGFGITYVANDTNLQQEVALKEFLPTELAIRVDGLEVQPVSSTQAQNFAWGLDKFMVEARTLARFDHPNIVKVYSVFEANNTAYMVMRYEQGMSLGAIFNKRKTLPERLLQHLVHPILDGLEEVHNGGFVHRDIKPDNIYLRQDGSPVLLDFGSARVTVGAETRAMTSLVSPGFAPFEQYVTGSDKQGPWSDIYSLGATLYRGISGVQPQDATNRGEALSYTGNDVFISALEVGRGRYSEPFLRAVDAALCFRYDERPQTVAEWRAMFKAKKRSRGQRRATAEKVSPPEVAVSEFEVTEGIGKPVAQIAEPGANVAPQALAESAAIEPSSGPRQRGRIMIVVGVVFALALGAAYLLRPNDSGAADTTAVPNAAPLPVAVPESEPATTPADATATPAPQELAPDVIEPQNTPEPDIEEFETLDEATVPMPEPSIEPTTPRAPTTTSNSSLAIKATPRTTPLGVALEPPRAVKVAAKAKHNDCSVLTTAQLLPAMRERSTAAFKAHLFRVAGVDMIGASSSVAPHLGSLQSATDDFAKELSRSNGAKNGQLLLTAPDMQLLAERSNESLKQLGLLATTIVPMQYLLADRLTLTTLDWRLGSATLNGAPAVFRAQNIAVINAQLGALRGDVLTARQLKQALLRIILAEDFHGSAFAVLKPGARLLEADVVLKWQNVKPDIGPDVAPDRLYIFSSDGDGVLLPMSQRLTTDASLGYHENAVQDYQNTVLPLLRSGAASSASDWSCVADALAARYRTNWRDLAANHSVMPTFRLPAR